ncbi:TPM domain-containing protein [Marinoscillum sp.]|uniref:TPM domain-containing protein n=1 Tax=Marinoscillum sp. TaxID=2024838 RepID=UPI003BAB6A38
MARYTFSDTEKEQVKQAVKDLETVSCGEIVPYFVNSSDDYAEASWYTAGVFGGVTSVLIAILSYLWLLPWRLTPLEVSLIIFGAFLVGFLIPLILPKAKRWIISSDRQQERVNQRALQAFMNEKVFETEERVGILIFISRLEHQVLVLGDEGISQKVKPEDWQHVVNEVINGIKANQIGTGLVKAISLCKDLLLDNGFVRKSTDFNELDDSLRIED